MAKGADFPTLKFRGVICDLSELTPTAEEAFGRLEELITRKNLPFARFETFRPQERQDRLWAAGRTQEGPIRTWTWHSRHTDRTAVDYVLDPAQGYAPWDYREQHLWLALANMAKGLGIQAGYFWPHMDPPHFQL